MKNLKYYPFERNRYFYGKLLSVDDFETEQKYMNNKRRLINRFVHGCGVVCGMNVITVDDSTVSIEKGLALDSSGREIIIDEPVTKKLSMIDGFDNYNDQELNNSYLYLCVEYAEIEKEPVHSITNSKTKGLDGVEYNKYAEGYHVFLTNQEPEKDDSSIHSFYEEATIVYWGNGIRIKQIVPKYVKTNEKFDVRIVVENMGQQRPFSFSYDLNLTCIQAAGKETTRITFDESLFEKAGRYELKYTMATTAVKDIEGKLSIADHSFSLLIGGKKVKAEAKGSSTTYIIDTDITKEIIDNYYHTAMEEISKNNYHQAIYLAKITVIKAGTTYVLDNVEPMPFNQYIFNNSLSAIMNDLNMQEKKEKNEDGVNTTSVEKSIVYKDIAETVGQVATGTAILNLGIGGTAGQKFFTQEIVHGLGLGVVSISLGEAIGLNDESNIIYGAQDIFEEKGDNINAMLAAMVNVHKGTFTIGLKCIETTNVRQVKVHWLAVKDGKKTIYEREIKNMNIKPDILNLSICETYYFEALISGEIESRVEWRVKEEGGGTIDENGMYTAPNKVGVFEIIAESIDYPEMKASTYVVVRNI